ncbi:hypothetical protein ACFYTQ_35480 [Nocardia sp. NPDC004068]|uniref:hypothetical protein n=1 Tax=Nocardia sp. NPDC004068 TaxID=3364303 RepID=UPI00368E181E
MRAGNEEGQRRAQALGLLSELRIVRERLPAGSLDYEDVLDRCLVAAAEALNAGVDEPSIAAVGAFSAQDMCEIRAAAAEFAADDEDVEREASAAVVGEVMRIEESCYPCRDCTCNGDPTTITCVSGRSATCAPSLRLPPGTR